MQHQSNQPLAIEQPEISAPTASSPLARKLEQFASLDSVESGALQDLLGARVQTIASGMPLVERGETPSDMHVVLEGWACRYRIARNGRRQILAFHLPGDVCESSVFLMRQMDSTITALSRMRVAVIDRAALSAFTRAHPRLAQGLWWESLGAASVQREWLLRNAQSGARERVASLVCELAARLIAVGQATRDGFPLPITQSALGDACSMTPEHTNRTLRELREAGLMTVTRGHVKFDDGPALCRLAGFDPLYLHFRGEEAVSPAPSTV
jgi:CRP-like cAMP-binding protein